MATSIDTDYGQLVRANPTTVETPKSIEALAATLKKYNDSGTRVTVRNTAHSTNGQTVTDGVMVQLGGLSAAKFDQNKMTVTAGAGTSWNDVLNVLGFPKFCLPIFPNNPGQRIHIGGTAAVGGVGYYGSAAGGFWNSVVSARLVTMTGDIIDCSREKNFDFLRYSLGGYARIGVMGEITVKVVPSKKYVMGVILAYRDVDAFTTDFAKARNDPTFSGVAAQEHIPSHDSAEDDIQTALDLKLLTVIVEVDDYRRDALRPIASAIRTRYSGGIVMFMRLKDSNLNVELEPTAFEKRELVFFSPAAQNFWVNLGNCIFDVLLGIKPFKQPEDPNLRHPWNDCILPQASYNDFIKKSKIIITRAGLAKYISKQSIFHGVVNVDSFVTFVLRKISNDFPVALDLPNEPQAALGVAIMPDVPAELVKKALAMDDELTNLCYAMGGRRYLYGYHTLTRDQVVQHYGAETIAAWNKIKGALDPKHLLNIGVIEHLDDL
jgi:FAD/FMN-containing dehydrogenase